MLKLNWMMNEGCLVATWNGRKQARTTPNYLTAETANHNAGSTTLRVKRRFVDRIARACLRVIGWRVGEFADDASLPRQTTSSTVTGPQAMPLPASTRQINGGEGRFQLHGIEKMAGTTKRALLLATLLLSLCNLAWADLGGKISGVVTDPSDAAIAGATVVVRNTATGAGQKTHTDAQGSYTFPVLAVGKYEIEVSFPGFKSYRQAGLVIDIGSALVVGVKMQLGDQSQAVTVMETSARVESSDTQLGQVIASKQVTEVPLNGRSYTDLFATQGGVTPVTTSGASNSSSGGGLGSVPVAGNANTGQFSINGQRESANGFYLNGATVQEATGQQAGIIPNLDHLPSPVPNRRWGTIDLQTSRKPR